MEIPTKKRILLIGLLGTLALIGLITALAPIERTLGERAKLVYFHGAWVWAGKVVFAAAAVSGLVGTVLPSAHRSNKTWQRASLVLGWTGMFIWVTYLPLSLVVQQMNWGGIFWEEPRWRVPLMLGIVGALLQVGLFLIENLRLAAAVNLAFGAALWWFLGAIQNVLHPDSPIFQSDALRIQVFFIALLALSLAFGALLAGLLFQLAPRHWK